MMVISHNLARGHQNRLPVPLEKNNKHEYYIYQKRLPVLFELKQNTNATIYLYLVIRTAVPRGNGTTAGGIPSRTTCKPKHAKKITTVHTYYIHPKKEKRQVRSNKKQIRGNTVGCGLLVVVCPRNHQYVSRLGQIR